MAQINKAQLGSVLKLMRSPKLKLAVNGTKRFFTGEASIQ